MSKIEEKIEQGLELTNSRLNTDLQFDHIEYDPTGNPNSENALKRAAREGLLVRFPKDNELYIDIDNQHSFLLFQRQFDIFKKFISHNATYVVTESKSGLPKRHIVVTAPYAHFDELIRVGLQAMLGSDRVRELLGYVQAENGDQHPTLFLEAGPKQLTGDISRMNPKPLTDSDIPF